MELLKHYTLVAVIGLLSVAILFGLVRAIRGPRRPDRIMGINMIGSFSTALLAALALFLRENWLLDGSAGLLPSSSSLRVLSASLFRSSGSSDSVSS